MFGANYFGGPYFGQANSEILVALIRVLKATTRGITGFLRTTRREY